MSRGFFDDPDAYNSERYGTGPPGSFREWKAAYDERMGRTEAEECLGDEEYRRREKTPMQAAIDILAITETTIDERMVKKAYRKMVFKVHPDYGGKQEDFIQVNAAYSYLFDLIQERGYPLDASDPKMA